MEIFDEHRFDKTKITIFLNFQYFLKIYFNFFSSLIFNLERNSRMNTAVNDFFYSRLPVNELSLPDLLGEPHLFYKVPENWVVVITDVKNSTKAAAEGNHQTVNLVATGSIVAALNVVYKQNITIPFFFGGDGATFIIPPQLTEVVVTALQQHHENVKNNFALTMRVGFVPVNKIYTANHELRISKLKVSPKLIIPVVLGDGLSFAEKIIKAEDYSLQKNSQNEESTELDMSGMHCRWDKIKPPATGQEVLSLLVIANDIETQPMAFANVMQAIDKIYGEAESRKPISIQMLRMVATLEKIGTEMRNRFGKMKMGYLIKTWFTTLIGKVYFKTSKGKKYLYSLVELSDTLVIDGKINTVISGTPEQRQNLISSLDKLEQEGQILYGMHVSTASVMSCYVRNIDEDHIHFIDGEDGGYTKAATVLKQKIAKKLIS